MFAAGIRPPAAHRIPMPHVITPKPATRSANEVRSRALLVLDQATMNEGLGLSGWTGALVRALAQRFADLEQMVRSSGLRRG